LSLSPNEQLDFELLLAIALYARAIREKEEDKEILELIAQLDRKVSCRKQRSLPSASSFGNALQTFVCNYFAQPSPSTKAYDCIPITNPPPARAPQTYVAAAIVSKPESNTTKKPHTVPPKPGKATPSFPLTPSWNTLPVRPAHTRHYKNYAAAWTQQSLLP